MSVIPKVESTAIARVCRLLEHLYETNAVVGCLCELTSLLVCTLSAEMCRLQYVFIIDMKLRFMHNIILMSWQQTYVYCALVIWIAFVQTVPIAGTVYLYLMMCIIIISDLFWLSSSSSFIIKIIAMLWVKKSAKSYKNWHTRTERNKLLIWNKLWVSKHGSPFNIICTYTHHSKSKVASNATWIGSKVKLVLRIGTCLGCAV